MKFRGKCRPTNPPTVWPGVHASVIPTPVPVPRTTKKSSFDVRTVQYDEIDEFTRQDRIDFKVISHRVVDEKYSFTTRTTAFKTDTSIVIQSRKIEKMEKQGYWTPVRQSKWATPLVPVPKKDGGVRICGDYKPTVNTQIEIAHHP